MPRPVRWTVLWIANSKHLIGVHALIFDLDGQILLQRHTYRKQYPWGLPGGWVHWPERPFEALRREVHEETGLDVVVGPLLAAQAGRRDSVIVLSYLCNAQGEPRTSVETSEIDYFPLDSLPKPVAPDQLATIELGERVRRTLTDALRQEDLWSPAPAGDTDEHY